jgi:hypothetical protein
MRSHVICSEKVQPGIPSRPKGGDVNLSRPLVLVDVDDNGRLLPMSTGPPPPDTPRIDLCAVFQTSLGTEAFFIEQNSLSVVSQEPRKFLFHEGPIVEM